jgi:hypothetical protein
MLIDIDAMNNLEPGTGTQTSDMVVYKGFERGGRLDEDAGKWHNTAEKSGYTMDRKRRVKE